MARGNNSHSDESSFTLSRRAALTFFGLGAFSQVASSASASQARMEGSNSELLAVSDDTEDTEVFIDEVLPGDKFGKINVGQYQYTLQQSGTRRPSWMVTPFDQDIHVSDTSYEEIGTGIGYGMIPFPPGQVPVLRLVGHIDSDPQSTTSLRVSIANREAYSPASLEKTLELEADSVRQALLEVTAQGKTQVFDEVYLSEVEDVVTGMDNGHSLPSHTLLFEAKTDSSDQKATIKSETTVALELEAL